jgi:hypothetical protein
MLESPVKGTQVEAIVGWKNGRLQVEAVDCHIKGAGGYRIRCDCGHEWRTTLGSDVVVLTFGVSDE